MTNVEKTKENLFKCKCKVCPTYEFTCKMKSIPGNLILMISDMSDKVHAETMFCAFGKSSCIEEKNGCLCPKCEVYKKYELDKMFFCIEDGEK
ncbi:MAG: hypothetical protein H6Q58_1447 [Firmicutes bacterium]|nr:hypothetical protein [Bacillota bacterium]